MATSLPLPGAQRRLHDHRFFLMLAAAMTVTVLAGFSFQLAMGRSTFRVPAIFHVHAFVFFGWTALYLTQTWLAASGSLALHRRLGWLGAGWSAAVVAMGITMTVLIVRRGIVPFFFTPIWFLVMNVVQVVGFGLLISTAIRLRRQTAWHNRLMSCAMAILTGAPLGRLLPLPLLIPYAGWAAFAATLVFPFAGMIADMRARGRVHPAWWSGLAAMCVIELVVQVGSDSAPGLAFYRLVTAGSPGGGIAPHAYPPFPPGP